MRQIFIKAACACLVFLPFFSLQATTIQEIKYEKDLQRKFDLRMRHAMQLMSDGMHIRPENLKEYFQTSDAEAFKKGVVYLLNAFKWQHHEQQEDSHRMLSYTISQLLWGPNGQNTQRKKSEINRLVNRQYDYIDKASKAKKFVEYLEDFIILPKSSDAEGLDLDLLAPTMVGDTKFIIQPLGVFIIVNMDFQDCPRTFYSKF